MLGALCAALLLSAPAAQGPKPPSPSQSPGPSVWGDRVNRWLAGRSYRFSPWTRVESEHAALATALTGGTTRADAAARYHLLSKKDPAGLAALLNVLTALESLPLDGRPTLEYVYEVLWAGHLMPDRIYFHADPAILDAAARAVGLGILWPASHLLHPGSTRSYKEQRLSVANVQLTFYERRACVYKDRRCVFVEADMDYYRGSSHVFLEMFPHHGGGGSTDPRVIYEMRRAAGASAGLPFDPPYTLVK